MPQEKRKRPTPTAVLREFVADVEAVGQGYLEREWPDLLVTYNNAKEALAGYRKHTTKEKP